MWISMTEEELDVRWLKVLQRSPGTSFLADEAHPLRVFVGSDDIGRARFVAVLKDRPDLPVLSEAVRVERGHRTSDGRWTLVFTVLDAKLTSAFMSLAADLLTSTADAVTESDAMMLLGRCLSEWRRLLTAKGPRDLSQEALRGLCGELWVALRHLSLAHDPADVMRAWQGPLGRPQDFSFPSYGLYEVKAVGISSTRVKISSAEQLDPQGVPMELLVLRLADATEAENSTFSLLSLIAELEARLSAESEVIAGFAAKLRILGVDLSRDTYKSSIFVVRSLTRFRVGEGFPGLKASALVSGITRVRYELAINLLSPFIVEHVKY